MKASERIAVDVERKAIVRHARVIFIVSAVLALSACLTVTSIDHRASQLNEATPSEHQPKTDIIPPLEISKYPADVTSSEPFQVRLDFDKLSLRPFRRYRTLLKNAVADGRANMAGHYKLVDLPCGSGCHYWWLVDLRSGQIHKTPSEEPVRFDEAIMQQGSRLVLFKGSDLLDESRCLFAYYEWLEEGRLFRDVKQGAVGVDC